MESQIRDEDVQDLLDALDQTPETVADLVRDLSEADLRVKDRPEDFSVIENVCHLRDIEIEGYTARINRMLKENNPLLPDVDGARLAIEREYHNQNLTEALQALSAARKQNTQTLRGLVAEQFDREGTLEGVGTVTIRGLVLMMRDHDAGHVREICSIRGGLTSQANSIPK
jgi:DinB superfamily